MSKVAIVKGDAYRATSKTLELANFKNLVKNKKRIVIKPNLTTKEKANKGITTDVKVVKAILDQTPNPEKVVIAEGSGGADVRKAFQENDYNELEREYGVKLVDCQHDEWLEILVKNPLVLERIKMSKTVYNSDFLISVAKLKIHSVATVTLSLKNMMGAVPKDQKMKIHASIPWSLIDLNRVKMPDFGVIDGVVANEIDECVPHPVRMGIVLASEDCIALDGIASRVMGINPKNVFYIWNMRDVDFDEIEVIGEKVENIKRIFKTKSFNLRSFSQVLINKTLMLTNTFDFYYDNVFPYLIKIKRMF